MFILVSGFFIKPLQAEFGWGRGLISMTSGAVMITSLTMPLVDRYGPRIFVGIGVLTFGACYAALAMMPGSPFAYLAILAVIGLVAGPLTAPLVFVRPIVGVFVRYRGIALGLAMSGGALTSIFVLPLLQNTIAEQGWRAGYWFMAPLALGSAGSPSCCSQSGHADAGEPWRG